MRVNGVGLLVEHRSRSSPSSRTLTSSALPRSSSATKPLPTSVFVMSYTPGGRMQPTPASRCTGKLGISTSASRQETDENPFATSSDIDAASTSPTRVYLETLRSWSATVAIADIRAPKAGTSAVGPFRNLEATTTRRSQSRLLADGCSRAKCNSDKVRSSKIKSAGALLSNSA